MSVTLPVVPPNAMRVWRWYITQPMMAMRMKRMRIMTKMTMLRFIFAGGWVTGGSGGEVCREGWEFAIEWPV